MVGIICPGAVVGLSECLRFCLRERYNCYGRNILPQRGLIDDSHAVEGTDLCGR